MGEPLRPDRLLAGLRAPYVTCSNDYIESVWWLLQRLHQRELLYRGHRVLPYCPRCGTVLSSHELALGYEDGHHQLGLRDLPAAGRSQRASCWSGPRRRGRCCPTWRWRCNPDLEYGEYSVGDRRIILATARAVAAEQLARRARRASASSAPRGPSRAGSWSGCATSVRWRWFRCRTTGHRAWSWPADFVTADDGSGLVHMAPAFGADDYQAGVEHGLALVRPVAPDGTLHRHHLAGDRRPAGHRAGDQRPHHPAAQAGRPLASDRAVHAHLSRTAGAAPAR